MRSQPSAYSASSLRYTAGNGDLSGMVIGELPHRPGTLRRVCEALSTRGIDLHHLYLTAGSDHNRCTIVFGSSNNERAVVFLNEVL